MDSLEDEWEYEYDETETEDFYVTLDLSGILPTGHEGIDPAYIPSLERRRRTGRHSYKQTKSKTPVVPSSQPTASAPTPVSALGSNVGIVEVSRVQILDLHTSNPLIAYQGQLLSCHWASTVGTDMLFAKSEPESYVPHDPLRRLPSFDLLGLSSTKLMASTAQLRPRDTLPVIESGHSQLSDATMHEGPTSTVTTGSTNPLPSTSKAKINQSNFLNRLGAANLKRKRDAEFSTSVPISSGEISSMAGDGSVQNASILVPQPSRGEDTMVTEDGTAKAT